MRILRTILKKVKAAVLSPFNAHLNTVSVIPQPYKKPLTLLRYTNPMRRKGERETDYHKGIIETPRQKLIAKNIFFHLQLWILYIFHEKTNPTIYDAFMSHLHLIYQSHIFQIILR